MQPFKIVYRKPMIFPQDFINTPIPEIGRPVIADMAIYIGIDQVFYRLFPSG